MSTSGGDHSEPYTVDEERLVRSAYAEHGECLCPRCQVVMRHRSLGGGSFGLGYARVREWLLCPTCKQSVLFDARRGTRT